MAKLVQLPQNTARELEKNTIKLYLLRSSNCWYVSTAAKNFTEGTSSDYVQVCDLPIQTFLPELNEARNRQIFEIEITLTDNKITEVVNTKKTK